jgi:signal peptidase II
MNFSRPVALVVAVVIALDQLTKHWAVSELNEGRVIDVVWTLRFALGFNSGFAFSQGQGLGPLIGLVAVGASVWLVRAALKASARWMSYAYALIAGGAIGNVIDRMFREEKWMRGRVVDFIDFQWFPVFNIADTSISIGAVLLVAGVWLQARDENSKASS